MPYLTIVPVPELAVNRLSAQPTHATTLHSCLAQQLLQRRLQLQVRLHLQSQECEHGEAQRSSPSVFLFYEHVTVRLHAVECRQHATLCMRVPGTRWEARAGG